MNKFEVIQGVEGCCLTLNDMRIVRDDTRTAMLVAVDLCEQGDFDSIAEAFKWLMQECE